MAIDEGLIAQHQNKASHEHETGLGFISDMLATSNQLTNVGSICN